MTTSTRIPVVDLARRAAALEPELSEAVARVVRSGRYLLGPETEAFEAEFAAFVGRRHAVAVASGTDALRLALVALGVGPGDEVIVPAFTAVPTAAAVCLTGATPRFADVDPDTAAIDLESAAAAVTDRTRAVIPVHLYGRPAPIPDLGVPVLEDAAQAHGAADPASGSAACAYSFYPTKNLGGIGDGGAVVTDDDELAAAVRLLRVHGLTEGYEHVRISTNSRLSEIEAAALRVGLARAHAAECASPGDFGPLPQRSSHLAVAVASRASRVPPVRCSRRRARRVSQPGAVRDGRALPPCAHPTGGVLAVWDDAMPRSGSVGGGVRVATLLPGDE